ncbi:LPS assembly lipoprotein LptE [Loktanella sp. Alg231-35]|uniref:LPS assembly lipoprotein LptE n=1 Tax=Loktanella sp. Alg231-35 TaxID=1922220 RepID=UPI001F263B59|nr:LPS assembly lipoprotein LptE [Loktanella sp. Alg231-35]
MSSDPFPRRTLMLGILALSGCGFAPIYGAGNGMREQVTFESDASVAGFQLNERLEERMGFSATPQYVLRTTINYQERAAAITSEGDTARLNIIGSADWVLTDLSNGAQVETGTVEGFTSYSAIGSTIATQSTRDDALGRLAILLADRIVSRLLVVDLASPA